MKATEFKPSDYRRIVAIARQAIITAFNERRFSFSSADIEDVSSDTLARVVKNWERYDESISESSWFSPIAYRCACAHMKREGNWRYHHTSLEVTTDDGEFYEVRQSDKEALRAIVPMMTSSQHRERQRSRAPSIALVPRRAKPSGCKPTDTLYRK